MDRAGLSVGGLGLEGEARILIVQPNRAYLAALARRVTEAGHEVVTAESAHCGLAQVRRGGIQLVLSELRLPGMTGLDLVRMLRSDPVTRELPVFLITGKSDRAGAVEAYRCGADAVIAKPFHTEVLIARIEREIERSGSLSSLRCDNAILDARVIGRAIALGEMRERWLAAEAERCRLERLVQESARGSR